MNLLRYLRELYSKIRLVRRKGIHVHSSSRVLFSKIRIRPECQLTIGKGSIVEADLIYERPGASIVVGERTYIGNSSIIAAQAIELGDDILVAWGCSFVDHDSHSVRFCERSQDVTKWMTGKKDWSNVKMAKIKICDKAWIGFNSIILKGVTIGQADVVAAGSVVTKDVEPYTLVAGNPARVIRILDRNEA